MTTEIPPPPPPASRHAYLSSVCHAAGVALPSCQSCGRLLQLPLPSVSRRRHAIAAKAISVAASPLRAAADSASREPNGAAVQAEDKWIARTLTAFHDEHAVQPASG